MPPYQAWSGPTCASDAWHSFGSLCVRLPAARDIDVRACRLPGGAGDIMVYDQLAPLQTPWDCRWTRLECRVARKRREPSSLWLCVRDGRRYVVDEECESCEHWETHDPD
jgi:hypothetical protein